MTGPFESIPESLKQRRAWVCWRPETRDGKQTKVPFNPVTGRCAKSNDPATWTDFATACQHVGRFAGLGIMFDDRLCGVDIDSCRDPKTGQLTPFAQKVVEALDSYTEVSPSGTGVHILLLGELPPGRRRKGKIEMYGPGSPRYFTVTGRHLAGTPTTVEDRRKQLEALHRSVFADETDRAQERGGQPADPSDTDLLARARRARNGQDFTRLWDGGYPEDDSAGDLALCNHLAFWTNGDPARMDALFRQSGRMRAKWDEKRGDARAHAGRGSHRSYLR
jgi:putative DNA primase/helicase